MELDEVTAVRLQMCDWAASTVVFCKFQDFEFWWECRLWKVAEVLELVELVVLACT